MSFHVCVWIDHETAKVSQISARQAALSRVEDSRPPHHIHRSADHIGLGKVALDPRMMSEVARQLQDAEAVLLAGPGQAKVELLGYYPGAFAIGRRAFGAWRTAIIPPTHN